MKRPEHDPSDDARLLRDGDPEAARRLCELQWAAARSRVLAAELDEVETTGGTAEEQECDQEIRSRRTDPYQEYDEVELGYRGDDWGPLPAAVARGLLFRPLTPGWVTVSADVRRLDGRKSSHELMIDLRRPDLVHALTVRIGKLLERMRLPCRGMLEVSLLREGEVLASWKAAVRAGATDPWGREEEERLGREWRALYREQGRTLRRFERMIMRMFTRSGDVIAACALVIEAMRGVHIVPPARGGAQSPNELLRMGLLMFSNLMELWANQGSPGAPPPAEREPDPADPEDVAHEVGPPRETAWSRAIAAQEAAAATTDDEAGGDVEDLDDEGAVHAELFEGLDLDWPIDLAPEDGLQDGFDPYDVFANEGPLEDDGFVQDLEEELATEDEPAPETPPHDAWETETAPSLQPFGVTATRRLGWPRDRS